MCRSTLAADSPRRHQNTSLDPTLAPHNPHAPAQHLPRAMAADMSEDDKVATLAGVTGVEDLVFCRRLLEAHGFDLEAAVNTAIGAAPPPDAGDPGGVGGVGTGDAEADALNVGNPTHQLPQRGGARVNSKSPSPWNEP